MVNTIPTSTSQDVLINSVNGAAKQASSVANDAESRFLKLLTTQLKNQDPLNPMDNAELTSQLAQISTVDGIERLNTTLQTLLSSSVDAEALQAAALVGRQVMVTGNSLTLTDAGAVGGLELGAVADQVAVVIKDVNGIVMNTVNLGQLNAGQHNFVWDGKTDAGVQAVNGTYSVSVTAKLGDDDVPVTAQQLASVQNINHSNQGVTLNLGSLGLFKISDIKQIF